MSGALPSPPSSSEEDSGAEETTYGYPQPSPVALTPKPKSTPKPKPVQDELSKLREFRQISYWVAHPPKTAWNSNFLSRSWLRAMFPTHFKSDIRVMKVNSGLEGYGREKLNMSETMWKALTERRKETRPNIPTSIGERQIVRCDEKHSLDDHSPEGTTSIQCAQCPVKSFDLGDECHHMMCPACISAQQIALSDDPSITHLLMGGAWEALCDDCMLHYDKSRACKCEWEVPRCLEHRREHLNNLANRYIESVPTGLCAQCCSQPITTGIEYAWHCRVCFGIFVLPNDMVPNWLPHLEASSPEGDGGALAQQTAPETSLMSEFDFSYNNPLNKTDSERVEF